jgi:hypothetical protein
MNAFHPDYIRTFYPQFLSDFRAEAHQISQGKVNGQKARHTRESVKGVTILKAFPQTRRRG